MLNVLTIGLIIVELIVLILMIVKMIKQKEVVDIKNTKYFFPTILVNLGVYLIAVFGFDNLASTNGFINFTECVRLAISACFLDVEQALILPAIEQSVVFEISFILAYIISVFTLVFVLIGLMGRYFLNFIKVRMVFLRKPEKFIILGYNDDSISFAKTIKSKNVIFWIDDADKARRKELLTKKSLNLIFDRINEKSLAKFKKYRITFISFEDDNAKILKLIDSYIANKNKMHNLYVSINNEYEDAFKFNYGDENINFFNRHSLVSQKFITDYPMTSFMDDTQIDTTTATVKNETELNVFLLGYGGHNKSLFNNLVIDNQFPTIVNKKPKLKQVTYHIFDREEFSDKNFATNMGRYYDAKLDEKVYNELPDKPMEMIYHQKDFYKEEFYEELDLVLQNINFKNSLNYMILSFGSDLDNIDQIIRVKQYLMQKGLEKHFKFFCRVYKSTYTNLLEESGVIPYGEYAIMDYDTIICEKLNKLSIERNFQKALKRTDVVEAYEEINKISSIKKQQEELNKLKINLWNELDFYSKDFDSFRNINMRTKLNLCGLDTEGHIEVSNKEFYNIYDPLNEIIVENRKKIYRYPYPKSLSPRNMLAFQEHLHSNAFWFVKGFVPMKNVDRTKCEDKMAIINPKRKVMATLTTFEGLDNLINTRLSLRDTFKLNINDEELDLKRSLYQIMDNTPLYKYSIYMLYKKDNLHKITVVNNKNIETKDLE
ncbi:MAG: hypothetical protein IJZ26_03500 [Clostridia bacterium]|nr:hypothetical protein [Clostridia bacterium]